MPKRYMPSLDNVIVWRAMELGRGAHIVFVVDAPYEPGFRTWGLKDFNLGFDLGVEYHMLGPEEIQSTDFRALCGKVCRVFFVPQDADALLPRLRTQLGNGTVRTHLNADGQVIGLEFVPPP
jgi:hypothetical protein